VLDASSRALRTPRSGACATDTSPEVSHSGGVGVDCLILVVSGPISLASGVRLVGPGGIAQHATKRSAADPPGRIGRVHRRRAGPADTAREVTGGVSASDTPDMTVEGTLGLLSAACVHRAGNPSGSWAGLG
jgi:hypothetical protein